MMKNPTLVSFFPFSTVLIVLLVSFFKYELLIDVIEMNSTYAGLTKVQFIVLVVFVITLSMIFMQLFWSLINYCRTQSTLREEHNNTLRIERETLILLFHALDGKNWKDKTRWCSDNPIAMWKGVKIDPVSKRVNKLILADNNLAGEIPEEISNLHSLIEIDFRINKIKGFYCWLLLVLLKFIYCYYAHVLQIFLRVLCTKIFILQIARKI
jgi:hypothetical protein